MGGNERCCGDDHEEEEEEEGLFPSFLWLAAAAALLCFASRKRFIRWFRGGGGGKGLFHTMAMGGNERCCGDDEEVVVVVPEDVLIEILVRLPVVSLLRFKSVSKSWCALIKNSYFINLHTTFNNNNSSSSSSSNKFGTFILHAAVDFQKRFRENALLMLSSVSEAESEGGSSSTKGGGGGRCSCGQLYEPEAVDGWWSSDANAVCGKCGQWWSQRVAEDEDQVVFKVNDDDDDDDDDQQQQQLMLKLDNFGFPSSYQFDKIRRIDITGSCNGLICIHDSELPPPPNDVSPHHHPVPEQLRDVSLWNPATRQFRILPKPPKSITIGGVGLIPPHRLVAFGFDAETKDYKVVLVSGFSQPVLLHYRSMECVCRVQVYSLSRDSWRLLEGINSLPGYPFPYPNEILYLNGICFFMAKSLNCVPPPKNNDRFIIALDLTKEIITTIKLPDHRGSDELYLCYLGDKIALFTKACSTKSDENFRYYDTEDYTIWLLNYEQSSSSSHTNKKSWTKLRSFALPGQSDGKKNIPRGISNDGEFVLLCKSDGMLQRWANKKVRLYNLVTKKELKKNFLSCNQLLSKAYPYKPSLVSILGGNAATN